MYCLKKSFYLFLLFNIVNALLQYYLFIILTLPTPSPGKYYGDLLHSLPPVPRKKPAFNLLLDLNDKNNDLSFAPNLVIFPNPKILVLQNDFFFHFCQVYWENLIKKKQNLFTCTVERNDATYKSLCL